MKNLLCALGAWVAEKGRDALAQITEAIEERDWRRAVALTFFAALFCLGILGLGALIVRGVAVNAAPIIKTLVLPLMVLWVVLYGMSTHKVQEPELPIDPVEEELARQRAREMQGELLALMFQAVQSTAAITPLVRPHDPYEIQTSTPSGDHFFMKGLVPIYQFEVDLESEVDKVMVDNLQRELQRHVTKQATRFPLLCSLEAQGRSPVEVLDVKPLGGHVCIDVVLTTAASIPLIEARRRARVERQQKAQTYMDADYGE